VKQTRLASLRASPAANAQHLTVYFAGMHEGHARVRYRQVRKSRPTSMPEPTTVYAIGHSTRTAGEFVALLNAHGVRELVDVRTIPRSRHNPQFNTDALAATLAAAGIGYVHMPSLGGLRRPKPDSINAGWRNDSFRGYADYMQTPAFAAAIDALIGIAASQPTAVMCAEAVPWRCHRSLIADALLVRGLLAVEIVSETRTTPHALTPFARVAGTEITYPAEGLPLG
jgi:uncharacterized protein (DUF488 family)